MTYELGDADIQAQYKETMTAVVQLLDTMFNGKAGGPGRETGFILMVFPFNNHEGRCNYMSNGANRQDVIAMMKEQIARFEGSPDTKGTA